MKMNIVRDYRKFYKKRESVTMKCYSPIDTNSKPRNPYVRKTTTKRSGRIASISVDNTIGRVKTQKKRKVLDICTSGYVLERYAKEKISV